MVAYEMLNAHTKHTPLTHTNYTQRGLSALYQCQPAMILEKNNETIALTFFCSVDYYDYFFVCDLSANVKCNCLRGSENL